MLTKFLGNEAMLTREYFLSKTQPGTYALLYSVRYPLLYVTGASSSTSSYEPTLTKPFFKKENNLISTYFMLAKLCTVLSAEVII